MKTTTKKILKKPSLSDVGKALLVFSESSFRYVSGWLIIASSSFEAVLEAVVMFQEGAATTLLEILLVSFETLILVFLAACVLIAIWCLILELTSLRN